MAERSPRLAMNRKILGELRAALKLAERGPKPDWIDATAGAYAGQLPSARTRSWLDTWMVPALKDAIRHIEGSPVR